MNRRQPTESAKVRQAQIGNGESNDLRSVENKVMVVVSASVFCITPRLIAPSPSRPPRGQEESYASERETWTLYRTARLSRVPEEQRRPPPLTARETA